MGGMWNLIEFKSGNLSGIDHLPVPHMHGAIILKWMLKTGCVMNSSSSCQSPVGDPFAQCNRHLCSKKGYGFLPWLT
jgi:hypothetical protein